MSVLIVIAFIVLFVVCLFMADRLGYNRGIKQATTVNVRCSNQYMFEDWVKKNRIIHKLEKRIFRLKRANRNLREEVRRNEKQGTH
jgi:hypothetical protein